MSKESYVWKFFTKYDINPNYAKCNLCKNDYKTSGNTSNLSDHLKRKHHDHYKRFSHTDDLNNNRSENENTDEPEVKKRKRDIMDMFTRMQSYDKNSEQKKNLDFLLVTYLANDMLPFSTVEHPSFIKLIRALDKRYEVPSRTQLKEKILPEYYEKLSSKLSALLSEASYVFLTTDLWTSPANESVLTLTGHFIYENTLKSAVLETRNIEDNHTAENIAKNIEEILQKWKIREKVVGITTDNASNMIKAADVLKVRHLPCFAHTLNLVVHDTLKLDSLQFNLKHLKDVVTYFKRSTLANEQLIKMQNLINEKKVLKLIQDCPTRWNSTFYMIQRVLEIREALTLAISLCKKAPLPITDDDFFILEDLVSLLQPFEKATHDISGDQYVTISLIIPLIHGLYGNLLKKELSIRTTTGREICNCLKQSIQKRLFPYETRSLAILSTVLDPRFKLQAFRTNEQMQNANKFLVSAVTAELNEEKRLQQNEIANNSVSNRTEVQSSEDNDLFDFLDKRPSRINETRSATSNALIIIKPYLDGPIISRNEKDILSFWKHHNSEILKNLALKQFCASGSSVPSERAFSAAGNIITNKRSCMKPEKYDKLIFLKQNSWLQ